jgi:predicted amidohydrolase
MMRLALYQNDSVAGDTARQLASLTRVAQGLRGKADLLMTPELFMTGYRLPAATMKQLAEPADGSLARAVAALARDTGMAILYGFPERDGQQVFNAVQVFGSDGRPLALYRKLHLPSDDERAVFATGQRIVTFDLLGFKVSPLICYDIEFPEAMRACVDAGADLVLAPTALRRHWSQIAEMVIPVRALENGAYLAYCNFAGSEADWHYAGLSSICAPDGKVLTRAGAQEETIVAELDLAAVATARARLPYLQDRRFRLSGPT